MITTGQFSRKFFIILTCSLAALATSGTSFAKTKAQCSWTGPAPHWTHFYNGRLSNGIVVRVTLQFHGCTVTGTWFDSLFFKDFRIDGSVSNDHEAALNVVSRDGSVIAKLNGTFFQHDPFGIIRGDQMGTGVLLGHLYAKNRLNGQQITMQSTRMWNGTDKMVAESVGIKNMKAFNQATLRFWKAVRDHNVAVVSKCVRYPLQAHISDLRNNTFQLVVVTSPQMLKREYNIVFNWHNTELILSHLPRHLIWTAIGRGVRLGHEAAIFDAEGKVTGVG